MKVGNGTSGFPGHVESLFLHRARGNEKARGTTQVEDTKRMKSDATTQKGVIRHLQEGHFKGVADVRLRLNLHAEIQKIEQDNNATLLNRAAAELSARISSEFKSLITDAQLDEVQISVASDSLVQYETDVANVLSDLSNPQVAIADLRSTTDSFLAGLNQLLTTGPNLTPSVELTPNHENVAINPTSTLEFEIADDDDVGEAIAQPIENANQFTERIDHMVGLADELFHNIQSSLLDARLPEPVRTNGNGVAFDKFLAIYRQTQEASDANQISQ